MNNFWKRFSCLLLIVPLFLSFFVIPADAAETQSSCFDLLATADSFMKINSYEYVASPIVDATSSTTVTGKHGLRVSTNAPYVFKFIYLILYSDVAPFKVYLNGVSGYRVNSSDSWSMWEFYTAGEDASTFFDIKATMPSNFSGWASLAVGAFYGFIESEIVVDSANFFVSSSGTSTHLPTSQYGVDLPTDFSFWADYLGPLPASFLVEMELESPVSYADYLELSISVPFVLATGSVSLDRDFLSEFLEASFFLSEPGIVEDIRPLEVIYSDIGAVDVQYSGTFSSFIYTFRIDTSGYNLADYSIGCHFWLRSYDSEEFTVDGDWITSYLSRLRVWPAYFGLPVSYPNFFAGFIGRFELLVLNINTFFEEMFEMVFIWFENLYLALTGKDPGVSAEAGSVQDAFDQLENFEDSLEQNMNELGGEAVSNVGAGLTSFGASLAFVGHWATRIADNVGPFHIVFTWPIFIGITMFIYHRVPGITRISKSRRDDGGSNNAG